MRSTTGILTLFFVSSVILHALTAHPVHSQCKMKEKLRLIEHELKTLNSSLKVNHVEHSAEITHHLVINKSSSTFKQNQSAACGLVYMEKALGRIRDHQRKLINDEHVQTQFKDIITRLNEHVMPCAHHVLAKCGQDPQPIFPVSHFKAKKWIRNFLDSSVKFLHQVIHLLETSKNHEEHH